MHRRYVLKRPRRSIDADDATESFAKRRDRRRPRGRLRAAELEAVGTAAAGSTAAGAAEARPTAATGIVLPELAWLFERGSLTAIEGELKSGKEATVYLGHGPAGLVAVKVYRDLSVRSFKADARYRAGRYVGDARLEKAIARRTKAGRRAQAAAWAAHEYRMLWHLHRAGVRVPEPLIGPEASDIGRAGEVVLMSYVGDDEGPAPRLADLRLEGDEADSAFDQSVDALRRIVAGGYVHGDYSTYNLLWWRGEVVVIDLPQAVELRQRQARELLERDAATLCRTFRAHGIEADPRVVLRQVLPTR